MKKKMDWRNFRLAILLLMLVVWSSSLQIYTKADSHPSQLQNNPLTMTKVIGAGYNNATQELIVVGADSELWNGVSYGYINENLLITLRAIYDDPIEWPGVTIEFAPWPGEPNVPEGHLPVYNFGNTDDTRHGYITFEADRLLKSYSLGKDNITETTVTSNVDCYMSVLDKLAELQEMDYQSDPVDPQRFFFTPRATIEITPDGEAITFTESHMVLDWAYIPEDSENTTANATTAAQYFVDCFNDNYELFAAEQYDKGNSTLYELAILGEIAVLADWIASNELDSYYGKLPGIHFPWLAFYTPAVIEPPAPPESTVDSTPAITVSTEYDTPGGTVIQSIYGGVTMQPDLTNTLSDSADALFNTATASRPHPDVNEWQLQPCPGSYNITAQDKVQRVGCNLAQSHKPSHTLTINNTFSDSSTAWEMLSSNPEILPSVIDNVLQLGRTNNVEHQVRQKTILPKSSLHLHYGGGVNQPLLLTFDWAMGPYDTRTFNTDFLYIRLYDSNGNLITTVDTISNTSSPKNQWDRKSFDLSATLAPYFGQEIWLSIEATTDAQNPTVFAVDNVFFDTAPTFNAPTEITGVEIEGPTSGVASKTYTFTANITPSNSTLPITYTWSPPPLSGQGTATAQYLWETLGNKSIMVEVSNCCSTKSQTHEIKILDGIEEVTYYIYLPYILVDSLAPHNEESNILMQPNIFHQTTFTYIENHLRNENQTGSYLQFSIEE